MLTNNSAMRYPALDTMKVLITSPSLNEQDNVSGISTMISSIIDRAACEFFHFSAGRRDGEAFDLGWLTTQAQLPFRFRRQISAAKPDVVHINTSFEPRSIIRDLVLAKSAGQKPVLLHVHGGRFVLQRPPNSFLAKAADTLLRSASRVVVLGQAERESLLERTPGIDVVVLPNAVDTTKFSTRDRVWRTKNILYVGRLHEAKGLDDIVGSCRMLVAQGFKFNFHCYGTGPDRERFTSEMHQLLGENFYYGDVVSGAEKIRAFDDGDIFLMPSRFEGLPLSMLEAMAAGCVPVVSARGEIPSVVEDGRNGFLVEPGDLTQIVGKLKFLLSEGESGWNQLRDNARRTMIEQYDLGEYVKTLERLYAEVAARARGK